MSSAPPSSARWGLIPGWIKEQRPGKPPSVNARCGGIATNGMFKKAYACRRCLIPIDGFFEWKDIFGTGENKQPYAIAMNSGEPFALAGVWESWRNPETGEDIRTFCVITRPPNEMMATIHDRMPVILHREDYERWLSPEPDPYAPDEALPRRADDHVASRSQGRLAEERQRGYPRPGRLRETMVTIEELILVYICMFAPGAA